MKQYLEDWLWYVKGSIIRENGRPKEISVISIISAFKFANEMRESDKQRTFKPIKE